MRQFVLVGVAVAAMGCFGIAASQAWVSNYVAGSVAELRRRVAAQTSGGVYSSELAVDGGTVSNVVEEATVAALVARDATPLAAPLGVTNGMLFAWSGADAAYVNGPLRIAATKTNLTFGAYCTAYVGAQTWLVDSGSNRLCRLAATLLQPSVAEGIGGGR